MSRPIRPPGPGSRMPAADRIWLGLGSPRNLMMVTAVLRFRQPVNYDRLRSVLSDRLLDRYPRFGQRVVPGRWPLRPPRWGNAVVDLDVHLQRTSGESLTRVVQALLSRPLDLSRPPWQCHLVTTPAGDALVVRVHHCVADGIALAGLLVGLTDPLPNAGPPLQTPGRTGRPPSPNGIRLVAGMAGRGIRLLALPRDPPTSLSGELGVPKACAWTPALPFAQLRAVAGSTGSSVNDVLLAVAAGALRRYLLDGGEQPRNLRVFLPVNVRPGPPAGTDLGNRLGLLLPRLPVAEPSALARMAAVSEQLDARKATDEAGATAGLIRLLGLFPPWAHALAGRVLGRKATAVVTNVPGPREPVHLAGAEVTQLTFWVPQVGSVALGISVISYAGAVSIGVASDAGLVPDPSRLAEAMAAEFADLCRAVR